MLDDMYKIKFLVYVVTSAWIFITSDFRANYFALDYTIIIRFERVLTRNLYK